MSTIDDYIRRTVEAAPPLTAEQRDRLALLLNPDAERFAPRSRLDQLPPPMKKCALYRHFDVDGNLLYVGISVNPRSRRADHARHSAFMEFAANETVEWFDDVSSAEDAERLAIRNEAPLFNRVHSMPDRDHRLVSYCIERGAMHLLKPL